ncbi:MAG: FHA domain-containing protein [Planctomycetes bacterium]|nr:FHA domain-containing protein [Planctomycetota bacterium]
MGHHALDEGEVSIGRSSSNTVVLSSRSVSREHCVIETADGVSRIRDLDSHHGTLVNGERIDGERVLVEGDTIGVGGFEIHFGAEREDDRPDLRHALDERTTALERRDEELRSRDLALTEAETALETQARRLEDARDEALDAARREHQETIAERDALRTRLEEASAELDALKARLDEAETAIAHLEEREVVTRETLDSESRRAREAQERVELLSRELGELEAGLAEATHRADDAETARDELRATARRLLATARAAAEAWRVLPSIEQLWFDADRDVAESAEDGPDVRARAEAERERAARELEAAHGRLDDALEDLDTEVRHGREDPVLDDGDSSPEPASRRRWWRAPRASR